MFFKYFSRQNFISRTFQDILVYSSTFKACVNPAPAKLLIQVMKRASKYCVLGQLLVEKKGSYLNVAQRRLLITCETMMAQITNQGYCWCWSVCGGEVDREGI